MHMCLFRWFSICLLLLGLAGIPLQADAQTSGRDYAVLLSDSSVIRGKLMQYKVGESVSVRLRSGRILSFAADQVMKVMPYREFWASVSAPAKERAYKFRESGWFGDLSLATYHGGSIEDPDLGGGLQGVFGLRINRWLETGMGLGYERYSVQEAYRVVPLFIQVRGYVLQKGISPFYQMSVGYGWSLKREIDGLIEGGGGYLLHPSVGVRFGGGAGLNAYLDLGYRFQQADYTRQEPWDATTRLRYVFKRFTFRLGIVF